MTLQVMLTGVPLGTVVLGEIIRPTVSIMYAAGPQKGNISRYYICQTNFGEHSPEHKIKVKAYYFLCDKDGVDRKALPGSQSTAKQARADEGRKNLQQTAPDPRCFPGES